MASLAFISTPWADIPATKIALHAYIEATTRDGDDRAGYGWLSTSLQDSDGVSGVARKGYVANAAHAAGMAHGSFGAAKAATKNVCAVSCTSFVQVGGDVGQIAFLKNLQSSSGEASGMMDMIGYEGGYMNFKHGDMEVESTQKYAKRFASLVAMLSSGAAEFVRPQNRKVAG